ncbi:polyprenyl synthetase family protein [Clostridium sediminicola]
MNKLKNEINLWFEQYFSGKNDYNKTLYEAMGYSIKNGGKRIRPILLLTTYSMYKSDYENVLPIAAAFEMIHTYSLIHDDLPCMDNDDLRRGKPTNHKVYGEAIAVLAGDGLLNEAMNIMFDNSFKSLNHLKACAEISNAAGPEGMIGGQIVDIESENKKISIEKLKYMHSKKTGSLIKASIKAGAILGEAIEDDIDKLTIFGEKLGLAFQIKDDILDITGDAKKLGKKTHSDDNKNKTTFISEFGLDECISMCENLTNDCYAILDSINSDVTNLRGITSFLLNRQY